MRHLLKYLKHYKKETILAPLFKLLEASFELLVPLVVAAIIKTGINGNGGESYILKMGALMLLLAIVGLVSAVTAQYFAAKAAVGFSSELKKALFAHLQKFSYTEIDELTPSTMITRMTSDTNQLQNGVNMFLRLFLRSPFIVFGAMVMAFTIDVQAALVFVIVIPILFVVVFAIIFITIPLFSKVQKRTERLLGISRENLSGIRVIRAFGREEKEISEFDERNSALCRFQLFAGRISALMNPLTYVILNCALALLIWKGGLRVAGGGLDQGDVVALVNYMSQILVELIKFANLVITITKAIASGNRVQAVFEMQGTLKQPAKGEGCTEMDEDAPFIEMKDVSFSYKNAAAPSLENITFSVNRGESIGIIGGTGSGKSTLVNLMAHFYDATEGEVELAGVPVSKYDQEYLHNRVAIVPQKAVLFSGTIRSNLAWGDSDASDDLMWKALSIAQADEIVAKKEQGLDSVVEQGGRNFSGGQKQRLTIARALVGRPDLLILDDSSSALDYATDANLRMALEELKRGTSKLYEGVEDVKPMTIVIVSQRTASVQSADRILVLDDGRLVGIGTHKELLEHCEVYREIHASQSKEVSHG